ncbi:hypothetical protein [Streptomyces sp. NPDC059378]
MATFEDLSRACRSSVYGLAATFAAEHHKVLDEITEPRLLTGDLWTVH